MSTSHSDPSVLTYLERLVNFIPTTADQERVNLLLDYTATEFEKAGLRVTRLEHGGVHSLYAHPSGAKHCKLLLQGHIDVVPAHDQPFHLEGDKIYGRGVFDMLFATACYLKLVHELRDELADLNVGIMLSGDEEVGGHNSSEPFIEAGYSADVCILPDAGEGWGELSISAKGMYRLGVRIHGKAHHGSRPWEGDGAAAKLVHFLAEAEQLFDTSDHANSTMTIARLQAGEAANQGPAFADCALDIRFTDNMELGRIKAAFKFLLDRYQGEITRSSVANAYKVDIENSYVSRFIDLYSEHLDGDVKLTHAHGTSEARFFVERDIPTILLRPNGGGAHGDAEWLSRDNLAQFYELLKAYVVQLDTISEPLPSLSNLTTV